MNFNIRTKEIFTNKGILIKKLDCKLKITQKDLTESKNKAIIGNCSYCEKGIYKTEKLSDEELINMVKVNPSICLLVNLEQENISHIDAGETLSFKDLTGCVSLKCLDCNYVTDDFTINMRHQLNDPHQCQECGVISNSEDAICNHQNSTSKKASIFCKQCKSTNLRIENQFIG